MASPNELILEAEKQTRKKSSDSEIVLEYFLSRVGEMFEKEKVLTDISDEFGFERSYTNTIITSLVSDLVDPVQQICTNEQYVGIIDYIEFEGAMYGYEDYNDKFGKRKRLVCSNCVRESNYDENIVCATEGEGTIPSNSSWELMKEKMSSHIENEHSETNDEIVVGASLISGTTIAGNLSFHAGNDGPGSALNADVVDGKEYQEIFTNSRRV